MTIHIPRELEGPIRAELSNGRFASEEDLIVEIVREHFRRKQPASPPESRAPEPGPPADAMPRKPIWEEILELAADVPDEAWDDLPADLSAQHDHYIYGTPKRTDR